MINKMPAALLILLIFLIGCGGESEPRLNFEEQGNEVPEFNADSAYHFVETQVNFGPRNPNSEGHERTEDYLMSKLREYAGSQSVFPQHFTHAGYDGDTLQLTNIIAAFNPESSNRILLSAHWDTRPRSDQDSVGSEQPILGADDGASGVAVLLEIARLMSEHDPPIGVDLVLFDGEDYGREGDTQQYFLGSRYWSNNPPVSGYNPRFGILLDMVGGEEAQFPQEQNSMDYAPALVNEIWSIAAEMGYEARFVDEPGVAILDDHVVVNQITGIPMIDIIRHEPDTEELEFAPYWHTKNDDMDIISRQTLEEVGKVLAELIYNRL